MSIAVTLVGGRGYTGEALLGLLERHPEFSIARVGSRSLAGRRLADVFPELETDLAFEALPPGALDGDGPFILALPNGEAQAYVEALQPSATVVDLSADYRFDDDWYYGLPELNPWSPGSPRRVANPGCYATAAQLAIAPVVELLAEWPSAFGVSGFSGAGRKPSPRNDPGRLADNLLPYALSGHGHEREISHRLGVPVRFSPHVAPFFRGISMTCTLTLAEETSVDELLGRYLAAYATQPLVTVHRAVPEIQAVAGTPGAIVGGFSVDARDARRFVVVSVLDNLMKGAASQAVQNLNALHGLPSTAGLES